MHAEAKEERRATPMELFLSDAYESSAIDYWAEVQNPVRNEHREYTSFQVRESEAPLERMSDGCKTVDEVSVLAAVAKMLNGEMDVSRSIAAQFVGKIESWEYDIVGIDCVIQCICFGELIYG